MRFQLLRQAQRIGAEVAVFMLLISATSAWARPAEQSEIENLQLPTFTFSEGKSQGIKFIANDRIADASGEAKVERKSGMTEIEIELDEMKTALHFGGDFATYVLWAVSPEGDGYNLGEFILKGNRSKLNVSTYLQTFGLIVTAEPHFMVDRPSRFVVLSSESPESVSVPSRLAPIRFVGNQETYRYSNTRLTHAPESSGEIRTEIRQANVALQLAQRAGAAEYASGDFLKARQALDAMILAVEDGIVDHTGGMLARETIRLATRAEKTAVVGRREADVVAQQVRFRSQITQLSSELQATRRNLEREVMRASGREHDLSIALDTARQETEKALGRILKTRKTAEGLVVSLPGILFDSNATTLKSEMREILSQVAGILQLIPGFHIDVEGHTDSIGSAEDNAWLSEARGQSVREFLVSAGVPTGSVSVKAFGEGLPIASNDTPEGRLKNRRVDLVILDLPEQSAEATPNE
jgi:outer membrane protein OmpA-like peptidoglycan-associated protein